jgi:hypothetical protein
MQITDAGWKIRRIGARIRSEPTLCGVPVRITATPWRRHHPVQKESITLQNRAITGNRQ